MEGECHADFGASQAGKFEDSRGMVEFYGPGDEANRKNSIL
jgi:hypothetical protein